MEINSMSKAFAAVAATTFLLVTPVSSNALEGSRAFQSDYVISMVGIPIAKSTFVTRINGDDFTVNGYLKSTGVARLFDKTVASTTMKGRLSRNGVEPLAYQMNYASGRKRSTFDVVFKSGRVVSSKKVPPPKSKFSDYVQVSPEDLKAVTDPLTAAMVKANSLNDVCNRTLRVFDGEMRSNLKLGSPAITKVAVGAYNGPAVTCSARFEPVSGYRKGHKSIRYLRTSAAISITFAETGSTGIYAPVNASVKTRVGQLTVNAVRFAATN